MKIKIQSSGTESKAIRTCPNESRIIFPIPIFFIQYLRSMLKKLLSTYIDENKEKKRDMR